MSSVESRVQSHSYGQSQHGAVLVIVLLILILMSTASIIALRSSSTSLDLTTTFQVNQLLFHASDAPLQQIQKLIENGEYKALTSETGPFGYLSKDDNDLALAEYTVCYQPHLGDLVYASSSSKVLKANGVNINPKGYCNIADNQNNSFSNKRKIIATQLSFIRLNEAYTELTGDTQRNVTYASSIITDGDDSYHRTSKDTIKRHTQRPFFGTTGQDLNQSKQTKIRVYVTSVMPSFSRVKLAEVDACLAKPVARVGLTHSLLNKAESQIACLERTGTPFNTQVQDYVLSQKMVAH
ncbi:hypothetical protein [Psychrobacter sp.]|uniref:hypothetical protein n=1 Tax=Psychrobacter sp. TaxID=56811 RepID=UPI0025EC514A|nr:hypothetical protein [Psychrobacter sp.]